MSRINIEWLQRPGTLAESWNPIQDVRKGPSGRGYRCTKCSPGCVHCWAETMNKRFGNGLPFDDSPVEFELMEEVLEESLHWRKSRTVGVQLMGDLWHKDVPDLFICDIFYRMAQMPQHTFVTLTKRAQRMLDWFNRPEVQGSKWHKPLPNVIGMVTAENQKEADKRIPLLLEAPFARHGVSLEPLLGPIDLRDLPVGANLWSNALTGRERFTGAITGFSASTGTHLDWVIVGTETGPGVRPMDPDWARDIRDQCKAAGVPFFFKAMSGRAPIPDDLMIREWPDG